MGGAVFTPKSDEWRIYANNAAEPTTPLAAENVAPTLTTHDLIRLRINLEETGAKAANNVTVDIQYSTDETNWYSLDAANDWQYADGLGAAGGTVTGFLLSTTDAYALYIEAAGVTTFDYVANDKAEWDWAIEPGATIQGETLYYFRFFINAAEVPLQDGATHPQVTSAYVSPYTQKEFRLREDDGSESGATWIAAEGKGADWAKDTNLRFRAAVAKTNAGTASKAFKLQYSKNGGTWTDVTGSSSNVRMAASANLTEGADTTQQISTGDTFVTNNNGQEDNDGVTTASEFQGNDTAELEFCVQIRSAEVTVSSRIGLRVVESDGTLLGTYTEEAEVGAAVGEMHADGFESGDFSGWDGVVNAGGDMTVTDAAALVGSKGLSLVPDDTTGEHVYENLAPQTFTVAFSFHFDPNTAGWSDLELIWPFNFQTDGSYASIAYVLAGQIQYSTANGWQINARSKDDADNSVNSDWVDLVDGPNEIMYILRSETRDGEVDGSVEIWIGGVLKTTLSSIDNYNIMKTMDQMRWGGVVTSDAPGGTVYLDEFKLRDSLFPGAGLFYQTCLGTFPSSGVLGRKTKVDLAGTFGSSGVVGRKTKFSLAGVMGSSGDLGIKLFQLVEGVMGSSGVLELKTKISTLGSFLSSGVLGRKISITTEGSETPTGALTAALTFFLTVAGTFNSSGTLGRKVKMSLAGTFTSSGTLGRKISTIVAGTMSSAGALGRKITTSVFSGSMGSSGELVRKTLVSFAGTMGSSGVLSTLVKWAQLCVGTMPSSGTLGRKISTSMSGSETDSGSLGLKTLVSFAGSFVSSGILDLKTKLQLSGAMGSSGSLGRRIKIGLAGTFGSSGALATVKKIFLQVAGTMGSSGTLGRKTSIQTSGEMASSGTLGRKIFVTLAGTFGSSGFLNAVKQGVTTFYQTCTGTFPSSGTLGRNIKVTLGGTFGSSGALGRKIRVSYAGAFGSSGTLEAVVKFFRTFAGTFTSSGALGRKTSIALGGTFGSSGTLGRKVRVALSGAFGSSGALGLKIKKVLSGTFPSSGTLGRKIATTLSGTFVSSGALGRKIFTALSGTFPSSGALGRKIKLQHAGTMGSSGTLGAIKQAITIFYQTCEGTFPSSGSLSIRRVVGQIIELLGSFLPLVNLEGRLKTDTVELTGVWDPTEELEGLWDD